MKPLFSILCGASFFVAQAQCVIDPYSVNGISPNVTTNLPVAVVEKPYSTVLQFKVPADTATTYGTFPITHIKVDSITGLPEGFSYQANPSSATFPGGSRGCVLLTGNPTTAQLLGGPSHDGVYPINVYFTALVNVYFIPTEFPYSFDDYKIQIALTSGVNDMQFKTFSISQATPNPAAGSTDFTIESLGSYEMDFILYDLQGQAVMNQHLHTHTGENVHRVDLQGIKAGMYLYTFRSGETQISKRLVVE